MQREKENTQRITNAKPFISYAGDKALFHTLEDEIVQALPTESIEWRRSYGRAPKHVFIEARFIEFVEENIPDDNEITSLIGQTFLHSFWTDSSDVEVYKTKLKDDITNWLTQLKKKNIRDWIIVVVEGNESRKGSKPKLLTRGSVLDKIKSDFCKKQTDRCISVIKTDNASTDSWQSLLHRLRQLLLQAYNRQMSRFEENMRAQRERRNEVKWNFCDYFLLQEELAFVFEMLGIYDEALVQYDELDALFTQFVINSNLGETPEWLLSFSGPYLCWEGLSFAPDVGLEKRTLIREGKATLFDLRNYLFSQQSSLLLLMNRPWEVAQRFLTFTHSCVNELQILEVEMPVGAVACWVFLSSLEVLQTCEKFNDSNDAAAYSYFTASLWANARSKLQELGILCGLMPGATVTSWQLHHVVELVAGMGIDRNLGRENSPLDKLKKALSSAEAFRQQYLELSEFALGTLKHIGRIRYARLIGRDLAEFYMKLGEPQKSAGFLLDALKTFQEEHWSLLSAQTLMQLSECYAATNDRNKFIGVGLLTACNQALSDEEKIKYFDLVQNKIDELDKLDEHLTINMGDILDVIDAKLEFNEDKIRTIESTMKLKLTVRSSLPKTMKSDAIIVAVVPYNKNDKSNEQQRLGNRNAANKGFMEMLNLNCECNYLEDKSIEKASITLVNVGNSLTRQQSSNILPFEGEVVKAQFNQSLRAFNVEFVPGLNEITLEGKAELYGQFILTQLIIQIGNMELILPQLNVNLTYEINFEPVSLVKLPNPDGRQLMAGVEQEIELSIQSGSNTIAEGTCVKMKAIRGLVMQLAGSDKEMTSELELEIGHLLPFKSVVRQVKVFATFGPQKDAGTIYRNIKIHCPWSQDAVEISLQFLPPFRIVHKMQTLQSRKFIQITVHGLNNEGFDMSNQELGITNCKQMAVIPLNVNLGNYVVRVNQSVTYLWEIVSNLIDAPTLDFEFNVDYKSDVFKTNEIHRYKYNFTIQDYKTLFTVSYKVEPKGSEFCRAGNMCNMNIKLVRNTSSGWSNIMYEVLADQTSWAVCGRTAGVVNMESLVQHDVTLDVMPLTSGFLPLPNVRISKYIPAELVTESSKRSDNMNSGVISRVEPFCNGQIYNSSSALQVFVIPALNTGSSDQNNTVGY